MARNVEHINLLTRDDGGMETEALFCNSTSFNHFLHAHPDIEFYTSFRANRQKNTVDSERRLAANDARFSISRRGKLSFGDPVNEEIALDWLLRKYGNMDEVPAHLIGTVIDRALAADPNLYETTPDEDGTRKFIHIRARTTKNGWAESFTNRRITILKPR